MNPELLVVIPCFNEQSAVASVIQEWFIELRCHTPSFLLLVIDDGSTDSTLDSLRVCERQFGGHVEIITRSNRGHGQSCLEGYKVAIERRIPHVLQIDSDGQCDPQYFGSFWDARNGYDVIYGLRVKRLDGVIRSMITSLLRFCVIVVTRANCADPNVPYRLMKTDAIAGCVWGIPEKFELVNVGLSVLLKKAGASQCYIPITFRARRGGEPSVRLTKFVSKAIRLIRDLRVANTKSQLPVE